MTADKPLGISYLAQLLALNRCALDRPLRWQHETAINP
jgi:hypothetical protein